MKHIKGLDTLRAFAVFLVMIQHKGVWFDDTVTNGRFIKEVLIPDGGFGVFLFFVLSGFLITTILLYQRSEDGNRYHAVKNFFVRRALRIFPIYFLLLSFLYIINYPEIRTNILYHATYTTNILCYIKNDWNSFSHAWTLSVEEQFYLLWPWLIIFTPSKWLKPLLIGSIIIGIVTTWYCISIQKCIGPFLPFNCFDSFGIGALLAFAQTNSDDKRLFNKWMNRTAVAALGIYLYWKIGAFFSLPVYGLEFVKTIDSILAVKLISLVINARPSAFRKYFLENRMLTFVGKVSYGIYLYHYIYNTLVYYQLNSYLEKISVGYPTINGWIQDSHYYYWLHVVLTILLASASYYIIERPFLALKKYFTYKPVVSTSVDTVHI